MTEAAAREALTAWLPGAHPRLAPLGTGHINDTRLVESAADRLVLQRINGAVFPDPAAVAAKVAAVTEHLRGHPQVAVPALQLTDRGSAWHEDAGGVWRLAEFVAGSRTLQTLSAPGQARAAGAAFGRFQLAVADLPGPITEPVPGFLRLPHYLADLDATLATTDAEQPEVLHALQAVDARRDLAGELGTPDRVIHGDCKIDNLLFHRRRDRVMAVIDLDTVMHGHWAWDFGDLVRSAAARGGSFSVRRFAAVAQGFVGSGAVDDGVAGDRTQALVLAPRCVALMLGVRFLTDHLRGDRYFKVAARGDNLRRAMEQLEVLDDMERLERQMRASVNGL